MTNPTEVEIFKTNENVVQKSHLVWAAGVLVVVELLLVPPADWAVALALVAVTMVGIGLIYVFYARPELRVEPHGLTVVNPFSSTWIPFSEVAACEGGAFLTLTDVEGRRVRVWAIQGRNLDRIKGQPGYADEVAATISERSARAQGRSPEMLEPGGSRSVDRVRAILLPVGLLVLFVIRDIVLR